MNKEILKEIITLLLDGEMVDSSEWQVTLESSNRLHEIFGTEFENQLDIALDKLFPHYENVLSLYGITHGDNLIRYKGMCIFFYNKGSFVYG